MEHGRREANQPLSPNRVSISAVVATYNEERYIGSCLSALLSQNPVPGGFEILVVDGGSTDRTLQIVRSFCVNDSRVRLLHNPKRLQVHAWNLALREMRGEYYAMIIAHGDYAPDYFVRCIEALRRTSADAVGGVFRAFGENPFGKAVAFCMSSPFGVGGARFRYLRGEEQCDSVAQIFTARRTLDSVGGWDERIAFDEDSDLCYRLRERGAKLLVSDSIAIRYYVRRSARALGLQMYRYGYWRRLTQMLHPQRTPWRILAPPGLVVACAVSALLACTPMRGLSVIAPAAYAAFLCVAAAVSVPRLGASAALVPIALAVMHFSYGWGYLRGLLSFRSSSVTTSQIDCAG
jgi:succinoglycan biosynthesis protein ExoA